MNNVEQYLALPIGHNHKPLCEVEISANNLIRKRKFTKIINAIKLTYSKEPYFKREGDEFISFFETHIINETSLVKINIEIIKYFMSILEINHVTIEKSTVISKGKSFENATERIIYLCDKRSIKNVIVGSGKSTIIHDVEDLRSNNIYFKKQDFLSAFKVIEDKYPNIEPKYSIIDSLFKNGRETIKNLLKENVFIPKTV